MTKEDYMCLPKERLAELLAERDLLGLNIINERDIPCYDPKGSCTNPFHDCINCPKFKTSY